MGYEGRGKFSAFLLQAGNHKIKKKSQALSEFLFN